MRIDKYVCDWCKKVNESPTQEGTSVVRLDLSYYSGNYSIVHSLDTKPNNKYPDNTVHADLCNECRTKLSIAINDLRNKIMGIEIVLI